MELGFINVRNLLPNQTYQDVLTPTEAKPNVPMDRHKTLRIYCREKAPCGGISILEHFEINVVPLRIALTYQFFKTMMKFCFPNNVSSTDDESSLGSAAMGTGGSVSDLTLISTSSSSSSLKKSQKVSNFYVDLKKDDVEIMKVRTLFTVLPF